MDDEGDDLLQEFIIRMTTELKNDRIDANDAIYGFTYK
jgi:hypothetical protein